ncbi:hypothetical protein ACFY3U_20520 [Micromonospora sp. NPDC000089]|uniref:hypothetical protein n=1 Tax=unclassified Micromonospora TaxID=2617518 RepID=UPI0036B3F424
MTDLDQRISDILRQRAEGAVDTDRLVARAAAGGRARRRRRLAVAGGGLALLAVLGGGLAAGPGLPVADRLWTGGRPAAPAGPAPVPPLFRSAAGAAAAPAVVGTDPQVLHFGVDPGKARYLAWQVVNEVESAQLEVGGRSVGVELARSSKALSVYSLDGAPSTVPRLAVEAAFDGRTIRVAGDGGDPFWVRLWRPAPGLYARATVRQATGAGLTEAAGALRLTEARRCGGPLQLSSMPAGARLHACSVDVTRYPSLLTARLAIIGPAAERMEVSYQYAVGVISPPTRGDTTINGRPAIRYSQGELKRLELLGFPKVHVTAEYGWPTPGFDELDAASVLAGARVAADPTNPETWG